MSDRNTEPVRAIRRILPYTSFAIIVALGYVCWVFYSRWHETRLAQQEAAQKEQAETHRIYELYGAGQVKILQLYANPGVVSRGATAQLCYGVSNAKSITIEPKPVDEVWPSIARCVDIRPTADTTYILSAEDGRSHTETAKVTVQVR